MPAAWERPDVDDITRRLLNAGAATLESHGYVAEQEPRTNVHRYPVWVGAAAPARWAAAVPVPRTELRVLVRDFNTMSEAFEMEPDVRRVFDDVFLLVPEGPVRVSVAYEGRRPRFTAVAVPAPRPYDARVVQPFRNRLEVVVEAGAPP